MNILPKKPENINKANVLVLDPMLATGGSANLAIQKVKEWGATNIKLVCLVAAPEGKNALKNIIQMLIFMLLH